MSTFLAVLSLVIWLWLLLAHGRFWQGGPILSATNPARPVPVPVAVAVVVPARDEADSIAESLKSLLAQDYKGDLRIVLVDDGSTDGTGDIARGLDDPRLSVITGQPRPAGWSGKLWAVSQGVAATTEPLVLLTDADIVHDPAHIATLVAKAETGLDMVSEMVELRCSSWAERALVPAFVYFFQMLYPFAKVNDPAYINEAAAAGGTVLIRRTALERIGGIDAIKGALIDDVTLASKVKQVGRIWLGHSTLARSIRPYPQAADVWRMIARTAYVQLRYSPAILAGTIVGLALIWLVPPATALLGHHNARIAGVLAWIMAAGSYLPTLKRFRQSYYWAPFLPLIAVFYMGATIGSALHHHFGRGVAWKGRAYGEDGM